MKGEGKTFDELKPLIRHGEYAKHPEPVALQMLYCDLHYKPMFIPASGTCTSCQRDIFGPGGYTAENAASGLITSCPFCHQSFCE